MPYRDRTNISIEGNGTYDYDEVYYVCEIALVESCHDGSDHGVHLCQR
jgi:hypothetical protein